MADVVMPGTALDAYGGSLISAPSSGGSLISAPSSGGSLISAPSSGGSKFETITEEEGY